ncbi:hypothetical protein ACFOY4_24295 [Actinomadura syzygii]|uniref:PE domain-containing protein n=1 Tax=Actinomadura syzygii TaxID=1427538 RepID=A0A5D0ULE8_9ACTN|nr:hypothetical protein [Actinomadura syzygii]TYC18452.1 hypothetical protein FXF65_01430 [Actinomadura syzygii]
MRQVARAMRAELAKLQAGTSGPPTSVGAIGDWDVPEDLAKNVGTAHESMLGYVAQFAAVYEGLIARIESSAKNFDLSELASQNSSKKAGQGLEPQPKHESQN